MEVFAIIITITVIGIRTESQNPLASAFLRCPGIMLVAQPFAEQDLKTSAIVLSTSKKAFSPFLPALNQWVRTLLSPCSASPLAPSP